MLRHYLVKSCLFLFLIFSVTVAKADYRLLVISDPHLGTKGHMQLAPTERIKTNDLDLTTYQTLLIPALKQAVALTKPNALLVLGDLINHADGGFFGSQSARALQLKTFFALLQQSFPHLSKLYVFGNNDSLLGDYQSYYDDRYTPHSAFEFAQQAGWHPENDGMLYGYYHVYLQPHLELIALNSVLFEGPHFRGNHDNNQLAWLDHALTLAANQHDSVILTMHIPPGVDIYSKKAGFFWQKTVLHAFTAILKSHPKIVIGILASHTHMDELRVMILNKGEIIPVIFTPGLSTSHGNAPAFKIFSFKRNTANQHWMLADYTTYTYSLTQNAFLPLYRFKENKGFSCEKNAPDIATCLQQAMQKPGFILTKLNEYYTAGNPNFHDIPKDQNEKDLFQF